MIQMRVTAETRGAISRMGVWVQKENKFRNGPELGMTEGHG